MSMEGEPKPAENLIGDMPFGITVQTIEEQAAAMREELDKINAKLAEKGVNEGLREFCENRREKINIYLATPADEIFRLLQEVYDFVLAQEQKGTVRDDILRTMKREKSELVQAVSKYYGVLRTQVWGYRVFQYLVGIRNSEALSTASGGS
ncbi:hypothetical protein HY933_02060 [Candidatus Falkowbacteria bacterium]|nr:hypothetical protein [Candidatus Falkowbacteria bacterium]